MKIIIDLPDIGRPTAAHEADLGRSLLITTTNYVQIKDDPTVTFVNDDDIDDAIEDALLEHHSHVDIECICGARNNMDGDVLHSHRLDAVSAAVAEIISVRPTE